MTTEIVFGLFAVAVAFSYAPWSERILRVGSVVVGGIIASALGYTAYTNVVAGHIAGYAYMWNLDAASALGCGALALGYLAAIIVAYTTLAREHLHGPMTLMKLRHHIAALHGMAALIFAVAVGNALWFVPLAITLLAAMWYRLDRSREVAVTAVSATVLSVVGTALLIHAGPAWNTSLWIGETLTGLIHGDVQTSFILFGVTFMFAALGIAMGVFPFGLFTNAARKRLPIPFAMLLETGLIIACFVALLRYRGLAIDAANISAWGEEFLAFAGVLTLAPAAWMAHRAKNLSDARRSSISFLLGCLLFVVGVGPAGIIAGALYLGALVPTVIAYGALEAEEEQGSRHAWASRLTIYLSLALPFSAACVPFLVTIGYGVQLKLVLTLIVLVLALISMLGMLKLSERLVPAEGASEKWSPALITAFVALALNVTIGVAATTPKILTLAIRLIEGVAESTF